ncbi:MAG: 16S rRNA (guanine(527)-N(7))-methyltransferase RsmG [Cytophagales bacterium]|nr:16S rRNA (guanine(527)-N(7))-methyltransferase RsmG [Cytophagales bacterium]
MSLDRQLPVFSQFSLLEKYFPDLSAHQMDLFRQMGFLYSDWNEKINVISRKDMDAFYERHVLHSLSISRFFDFPENSIIVDIGTGGGFPGVPLAIMNPSCKFILVDSIGKKIQVVASVAKALKLKNVEPVNARVESIQAKFDYAITRAVAPLKELHGWTRHGRNFQNPASALVCLKGGDLTEEIAESKMKPVVYDIAGVFEEAFFETKKVLVAKY